MEPSDEDLLSAWRAGDKDAGTVLFRRYFGPCRRFFVNKVPEREVDDLLQKTFTAMVEGKERFRGEASFRSYVFSIARRVFLRFLRDHAHRDSKNDPDLGVSSIAALGVTPGTAMALERDQAIVREALQQIPVHLQTVVELSYWEEMGTQELATVLDVAPATVRTRLFRARKALAEVLEHRGLTDEAARDHAVRQLASKL